MGKTRSELREIAVIILYQISIFKKNNIEYNIDDIIKENLEIDNDFVKDIIYGVSTHEEQIISDANKYMKEWNIDRIDKIGAAILKIAIYELQFTDTPHIVAINEAIELAKKFSDDSVRKIINAVLDRLIKE